jgi:ribosomal protein S1
MKQLETTPTDQFAQGVAVGDRITGRITRVAGKKVIVQLGEGVEGVCTLETGTPGSSETTSGGSLAEKLAAAWKGGIKPASGGPSEPYQEGQLRSFTIKAIDPSGKKIELSPA